MLNIKDNAKYIVYKILAMQLPSQQRPELLRQEISRLPLHQCYPPMD